ncbi:MAG: class I SAM-dependent methyltransferase [Gemmatimonadota bacterium]
MTHSVRQHLGIEIDTYDATIRRYIPGYESMLEEASRVVQAAGARRALDLGAGSGSLSAALLARAPTVSVDLLDVDEAMLELARARLARHGDRARFVARSFLEPIPPADAVMASLALHHVPTLAEKEALYGRIFDALPSGGVFVCGDVTIPQTRSERDATYREWVDHMVTSGIDEERCWTLFDEWAREDTYFPLDQELEALGRAGFDARLMWRLGPTTVWMGQRS